MARNRYTNEDVRGAFVRGEAGVENRTGSMKTVRARNGDTLLVGYGWMIYGENDGSDIIVYEGWSDWAREQNPNAETSPRHIRNLKPLGTKVVPRTPKFGSTPDSVREIGRVDRWGEING